MQYLYDNLQHCTTYNNSAMIELLSKYLEQVDIPENKYPKATLYHIHRQMSHELTTPITAAALYNISLTSSAITMKR